MHCDCRMPVTSALHSRKVFIGKFSWLKKGKGSPYSTVERRVPELIPVPGSQPAGVSHNPAVGCHYFPSGLQLPSQPLIGLLPISLLGGQRHDGCKQFVKDCYRTASRLRFEPRPFCAGVQHASHSAILSHPYIEWQWRNFVPYLSTGFRRHLVGKLLQMFSTLLSLKYAFSVG